MTSAVLRLTIAEFRQLHPYVAYFFEAIGQNDLPPAMTISEWLAGMTDEFLEEAGLDRDQMINHLTVLMEGMNARQDIAEPLASLEIIGGRNKNGKAENVSIVLKPGEIVSIVGPTGSGKSRLLADIECMAQGDTPTGRRILLNGRAPLPTQRFCFDQKLVAQISQNMNFVVDVTVGDFVAMHAQSRMIESGPDIIARILHCANELSGEPFTADTSVTQLSGGQSRALMIADTALLCASPVILIDEIENAGVNRKKALELLVKEEKIVLISTHDPLLALLGDRRIIIRNGGIASVLESDMVEKEQLKVLEEFDRMVMELREKLRNGERISVNFQTR